MHAVQIDALRPSLATDTCTGNSAVTEFDGLALPLELTLVFTNDEDRSPEPPKGNSPGTLPGSWKPAFEAHVARSPPYFGRWSATLGVPGHRELLHRCSNGPPPGRSTFPRRSTRCRWCSMTVLGQRGSPSATASKHVPGQAAGCSRTCCFAVSLCVSTPSSHRRHFHKLGGVGAYLVAAGGPSAPVRLLARHEVAPDG